jgi:hypothetical protein
MVDKPKEPTEVSPTYTEEELFQRNRRKLTREKFISRARAAVVRSQIVRAYEILDKIRFDYVSDTAFREKICRAKRALESAIDDFLMYDGYWDKRIDEMQKMTDKEFKEYFFSDKASADESPKK